MELLNLFFTFFKIGAFSFGGGYAMIPIIKDEIISHGWMTLVDFFNIISITEMTPGPIAINTATYAGNVVGGFFGGLISTIGVILPSFIIVIAITFSYEKFKENKYSNMIFYGVRAVVVGMIASAGLFIAKTTLLDTTKSAISINIHGIIIFIICLFLLMKYKLHPILIICLSAFMGIITLYV
ncbi:chromate transporter [Abyssisolibacter fermentans]|uniref:chromate transporter n=1 Tax=Abyssisolibacter fermentans TaxID=1766203 RepID=UPI000835B6ED|nr:chromate transporter [Abyssisolibacter fermentans]